MPYLDEGNLNDLLYYYMANNELDWADRNFREELLEVAYTDLKYNEQIENYEKCQEIKDFMEWADMRF